MPDLSRRQEVFPQAREYLVYTIAAANSSATLEMLFDEEVTLDDVKVSYFTTQSTAYPPAGDVVLEYPTGEELTVASSVSNWSMNQDNDSRNLWYSLPPRTKLQWKPSNPENGLEAALVLNAIGHSGG